MPETSESELAPNVKALWLKALSAVQTNNHGYAVKLIQTVLKDAPTFLEGRQVLRKCETIVTGGPKKKSSFLGMKTSGGFSKIASQIKKDPVAALPMIEEELEKDPFNPELNDLLFEAFNAMGLLESAAFALETIRKGHPEEAKLLHKLENPDLALYKIKQTLYKFAFLLVPISLPFLWLLFFWKRGVTLFDHTVYILYSLSFVSLLFIALALLAYVPGALDLISPWWIFAIPVHAYFQMKGGYSLGWFSALWRTPVLMLFALLGLAIFLVAIILVGVTG